MKPLHYKGEFSLLTLKTDNIETLNTFLKKLVSKQQVIKRPYKRQYKFALIHFTDQGRFTDQIFDMGDKIYCKPFDSIIRD